MLVRCIIEREGGTVVDMTGWADDPSERKYHFKPNRKGHHVCEVRHKADLKRLLSIADGFEPYDTKDPGLKEADEEPPREEPAAPVDVPQDLREIVSGLSGIDDPDDKGLLVEWAQKNYGVDLDKRRSVRRLWQDIVSLVDGNAD